MITMASTLGTTRYSTGSVRSIVIASICSVTFMVPSWAAKAVATLPVSSMAVSSGAISRDMPRASSPPTVAPAPWPRQFSRHLDVEHGAGGQAGDQHDQETARAGLL